MSNDAVYRALLGASLNRAYQMADNPSPGQFVTAAFEVYEKHKPKPTFEAFVKALCEGRDDEPERTNVVFSDDDGIFASYIESTDLTPTLKASYERLYGEKPDVKPKPTISTLMAAFSYHAAKETAIMNVFGASTDEAHNRCKDNDEKLKADLANKGLAHLIDWEDGFWA